MSEVTLSLFFIVQLNVIRKTRLLNKSLIPVSKLYRARYKDNLSVLSDRYIVPGFFNFNISVASIGLDGWVSEA